MSSLEQLIGRNILPLTAKTKIVNEFSMARDNKNPSEIHYVNKTDSKTYLAGRLNATVKTVDCRFKTMQLGFNRRSESGLPTNELTKPLDLSLDGGIKRKTLNLRSSGDEVMEERESRLRV